MRLSCSLDSEVVVDVGRKSTFLAVTRFLHIEFVPSAKCRSIEKLSNREEMPPKAKPKQEKVKAKPPADDAKKLKAANAVKVRHILCEKQGKVLEAMAKLKEVVPTSSSAE